MVTLKSWSSFVFAVHVKIFPKANWHLDLYCLSAGCKLDQQTCIGSIMNKQETNKICRYKGKVSLETQILQIGVSHSGFECMVAILITFSWT